MFQPVEFDVPTGTPTPEPTDTPTIIWFPATATATYQPLPPRVPTPQGKPEPGEVIYEDDFSDKTLWQTSRSDAGSVAYGKNELTIAIMKPGGSLISLSEIQLPMQHYLEINASPSLCRGEDSYGLLMRVRNPQEYYRLSINCNGQIKFDHVRGKSVIALTDWMPSGQVLPGPMLELRLGIWSGNNSLAVFINDVNQLTISHPGLKEGITGVFARSAGQNALTVNFSDLVVYEASEDPSIPQPTATPTRRPSKTPYVK